MKGKFKKSHKMIVIFTAMAMVTQMFIYSIQSLGANSFTGVQKLIKEDADDRRIAAELSNMTGMNADEILKLKNMAKTWNQVMEILKNQDESQYLPDRAERRERLAEAGLDKDYIDQLKQEGYTEEQIIDARLLVERILYQLSEITQSDEIEPAKPVVEIRNSEKDKEDISAYRKVMESFQEKKAIYLILKLKDDFGSMEEVLNEYLLSLQVDMNLEDYIRDKEQYLEEKKEKSINLTRDEIITIAKIENKLLEIIQQENEQNRNEIVTEKKEPMISDEEVESPLPDIPQPDMNDIKPVNPAEELMQEIKAIDPSRTEMERSLPDAEKSY